MTRAMRKCLWLPFFLMLGACGTYVPQLGEVWEAKDDRLPPAVSPDGALAFNIKKAVYCGIFKAVQDNAPNLPPKWAAQLTLDLQVDETSAINPGASLITPMHSGVTNFVGEYLGPSSPLTSALTFGPVTSPQSYTLGLGGTISSQSTREDKFSSYWELDHLRGLKSNPICDIASRGSSLLLINDLRISEWLYDHLIAEQFLPSTPIGKNADSGFKQDALSYHVKFIVITSGNVTPAWKLVRVATNQGGLPLASVNRTRTHDLLITYGPAFKAGTPNIASSSHAAQETGIAVRNSETGLFSR